MEKTSWRSRVGQAVVLLALGGAAAWWSKPIWAAELPPPIPDSSESQRFGLSLADRQTIFAELARREGPARRGAERNFPGQLWSIEDDRGHVESRVVHQIAQRRNISASQVYLVLDEGLRNHWTGSNGEALPATVPPLEPRRR